jgi:NAD+ kinase
MNNYIIVCNEDKKDSNIVAKDIEEYIASKGGKARIVLRNLETMRNAIDVDDDTECVIVLGGDGSILRTVRGLYPTLIPVVGVNMGHLGFLTQTEPSGVKPLIDRLFADDYTMDERMMLKGDIYHNGEIVDSDISLNDIVISRSGISRIVKLELYVNGELLDVYDADGVIVSTPTGSTAYNLSAGGPVVCPKTSLMLVTPISPHALTARSVVLSDTDELRVVLGEVRTAPKEGYITFDGQIGKTISPLDSIVIKKLDTPAKLIRVRQESFYEVLRDKIK